VEARRQNEPDDDDEPNRRRPDVAKKEAAARGENAPARSGEEPPRRLVGGAKLTAKLNRRSEPSERFADCSLMIETLGFQSGDRVGQVIEQFGPDVRGVPGRKSHLSRHPIQIDVDRIGVVGLLDD
jgi:hypothetical protein